MDKRINWFIPPLILIIIIIAVNIVYYRKKKHSLKRIVIKQENTKNFVQNTGPKLTKKKLLSVEPAKKERSLAVVSKKSFAIQVASFRKKKRALSFIDSLKKDNYDAYIVTKNLGGKGVWYRVRIGNFSTKNEAGNALKEIKTKYLQSFITLYVSP